jgi:hypothetical protein
MGDKKNSLKTDMNDRERQRFATQLREMSKTANEAADALDSLADALDSRDDTKFVMSLVIFSLQSGGMREMMEVAKTALLAAPKDPVLDAAEIG